MWLVFSFLTAFFTSLQDVFSKRLIKTLDVYVIAWAGIFFTLPVYFGLLPFQKIPSLDMIFVLAACVSTLVLSVSVILYVKAIKYSDLSLAMPMLAFTPLFLLVTSPLILGEFPEPKGILGIILIMVGSYWLFSSLALKGFLAPLRNLMNEKGARYMLAVALLFSIGANVDKIGIRHSSPFFWCLILNCSVGLVLTFYMVRKVPGFMSQIRIGCGELFIIGIANAFGFLCNMLAIQLALVPYVISIKRTSVIMTSLLGFFVFKEQGVKQRLLPIVVMVLGVILVSIAK